MVLTQLTCFTLQKLDDTMGLTTSNFREWVDQGDNDAGEVRYTSEKPLNSMNNDDPGGRVDWLHALHQESSLS